MRSTGIKLLVLTNSPTPDYHFGQLDGYQLLVNSGEMNSLTSFSHELVDDQINSEEALISKIAEISFDALLIWTPKLFPSTEESFDQILQIVGCRPIFYYDGDPWLPSYRHFHKPEHKKKSATRQMGWWASNSAAVFTVASKQHFEIFQKLGAKVVHFMPHTYCHFYYSEIEQSEPMPNVEFDAIMIGSNLSSIPSITGVPGSLNRMITAKIIRNMTDVDFRLYGSGWPKKWRTRSIPFESQAHEIRKARISINWDHFDKYEDYASDRLPISLLAGRPHITSKHPGMSWIPGSEIGLFEVSNPRSVRTALDDLLGQDTSETYRLGLEGHRWVKNRLSHREAARYIMSKITSDVSPLKIEPWVNLPSIE